MSGPTKRGEGWEGAEWVVPAPVRGLDATTNVGGIGSKLVVGLDFEKAFQERLDASPYPQAALHQLDFEAAHKATSLSVTRYAAIEAALNAQHQAVVAGLRTAIERLTAERDEAVGVVAKLTRDWTVAKIERDAAEAKTSTLTAAHARLHGLVTEWQEAWRVRLEDHADTRETFDRYSKAKTKLAVYREDAP